MKSGGRGTPARPVLLLSLPELPEPHMSLPVNLPAHLLLLAGSSSREPLSRS